MQPDNSPFQATWSMHALPGLREIDATYGGWDYGTLPPLPAHLFDGSFSWLPPLPDDFLCSEREAGYRPKEILDYRRNVARLEQLEAEADSLNIALPASFVRFMGDSELVFRMRSCTDCYFTVPRRILASGAGDAGYFLRFLSDSQDCGYWHLWLATSDDHCVVCSDDDADSGQPGQSRFVAPDFESFIYRMWVENELWFRLTEKQPLTALMQEYADHYRHRD